MNRPPQWRSPGQRIPTLPGVEPEAPKQKPPRDYLTPAITSLGACIPASAVQQSDLVAAIIVAQALDRLGETMTQAAAIASYKR